MGPNLFLFLLYFQDLQHIGIDTRGHRQKLLRDIRKIPRVDIEENIPVSSDQTTCWKRVQLT